MERTLKTDLYRQQSVREMGYRDSRERYAVGETYRGYVQKPHVTARTEKSRMGDGVQRSRTAGRAQNPHMADRVQGSRMVGRVRGSRTGDRMQSSRTEDRAQKSRMTGSMQKSRKRKRVTQRKVILGLWVYFGMIGVAATCWMLLNILFDIKGKMQQADAWMEKQEEGALESGILQEEDMAGPQESLLEVSPELREKCQELYSRQEELLVLVNKNRELSMDYQPRLRNICHGRLQAADILYEDLSAMLQAAGREGYEYWIASAYRDRGYQQGLVDEDVENYMAKGYSYEGALQKTLEYTMPAGFSEHETGLALDILCSTNTMMDESQEGEPGNRWLREHCQEYGFILRYPKDKEDITMIKYEPWHLRYVGKEAAGLLAENGLTLEEFYEILGE